MLILPVLPEAGRGCGKEDTGMELFGFSHCRTQLSNRGHSAADGRLENFPAQDLRSDALSPLAHKLTPLSPHFLQLEHGGNNT